MVATITCAVELVVVMLTGKEPSGTNEGHPHMFDSKAALGLQLPIPPIKRVLQTFQTLVNVERTVMPISSNVPTRRGKHNVINTAKRGPAEHDSNQDNRTGTAYCPLVVLCPPNTALSSDTALKYKTRVNHRRMHESAKRSEAVCQPATRVFRNMFFRG